MTTCLTSHSLIPSRPRHPLLPIRPTCDMLAGENERASVTDGAPRQVRKRDGRIQDFERERIVDAVFRAARETGRADRELAEHVTDRVVDGRPVARSAEPSARVDSSTPTVWVQTQLR
jgi:hypothetical protein